MQKETEIVISIFLTYSRIFEECLLLDNISSLVYIQQSYVMILLALRGSLSAWTERGGPKAGGSDTALAMGQNDRHPNSTGALLQWLT